MRSIRSCSRARTNSQRGFALIAAIALAILYFLLVELMLLESSRELAEARRFRARIIAATLAENGAELAAVNLVTRMASNAEAEDWQGTINGRMLRTAGEGFDIWGEGKVKGVTPAQAKVFVRGRIVASTDVRIQYTIHTP